MKPVRFKRLGRTALFGAIITCLVIIADNRGWLAPMERLLYDARALSCQFFSPPATDRIVHVDIDDAALEANGAWPWPRSVLASIIDEITNAGASVILLDIFFPEPQPPTYNPLPDATFEQVEHDAILADSFRRTDRLVLPMSLTMGETASPLEQAVSELLREDLEAEQSLVVQRLRRTDARADLAVEVERVWTRARERAAYERIVDLSGYETMDLADLRRALLPRTDPSISGSPLIRLLQRQHRKALANRAVAALSRQPDPSLAAMSPLMAATGEQASLAEFAAAARYCGFVDYLPFSDGVLRSVPLWVEHRGRLVPQAGFALACATLGVDANDPRQVSLAENQIVLRPASAEPIVVPVSVVRTRLGRRGMFFDVPWFGGRRWESMYGSDEQGRAKRHISINAPRELWLKRQRAARNNLAADEAATALLRGFLGDPEAAAEIERQPAPADDYAARASRIEHILNEAAAFYDGYKALAPGELEEDDRRFVSAYEALSQVRKSTPALMREVESLSGDLRRELRGKAVIIGMVATGSMDVVNTSLHPRCPGPVVHGVIANGLLSGHVWRRAPAWVTPLATLTFGLLATAATAFLPPWRALASAGVLGGGYLLMNGLVLFDYGDIILGIAGPATAVALSWAGCTLFRFIAEAAERTRITSRFQCYVDPALVEYVVDNPDLVRLEAHRQELTVVFVDLAGFTSLSEVLREEAVPILSEFMGTMVPIIRRHRGYVNKFLGDGIMFFFNAFRPNPRHAADAAEAVLEMRQALEVLNQRLRQQALPTLSMRAGINTGDVILGDAGPPEASDFTALGDAVNFAARLESANKPFGTSVLMGQRTANLIREEFLLSPIGRLQVAGKREWVEVFELIVPVQQASDLQVFYSRMAAKIVEAYQAGKFEQCLSICESLPPELRELKLFSSYASWCRQHIKSPPVDFAGQITLVDK
ncbi:MAG TPA: CHASE2 domain-containing protein [Tepidisphaeraceae bacterium]|nr:CHASE2 domain-containing protein [Tepidisphaeraceae bacterium]